MTFQQQGQDQPIHQFLGFIQNPRRYCYKIWETVGTKLTSKHSQARGAGSSTTIPFTDLIPHNNNRLLLLPDNHQDTATLISEHKSLRLRWSKPAKDIPEWIKQVAGTPAAYLIATTYIQMDYKKNS